LIEKPELGNQSKDIENHVSPFAWHTNLKIIYVYCEHQMIYIYSSKVGSTMQIVFEM
jgi:hypothetical protein